MNPQHCTTALLCSCALAVAYTTPDSEPSSVPYAEIAENPQDFRGESVRVLIQFHSLKEGWNPYMTRFGVEEFHQVRAWADEQLPWIAEEFGNPSVRFFVRRKSPVAEGFLTASPHDRFAVTCVVRELFAGRPWAEIIAAEPQAEYVPEGSVLHAIRALELMGEKTWKLAASELERALTAPVPAHARRELDSLLQVCLEKRATRDARRIPATKRD